MTSPDAEAAARRVNRERFLAIALMCGAVTFFSALDATAKWLTPRIGVWETTWARYISSFLFVSVFLNPWTRPAMTVTKRPWLQMARSAALFGATILNFLALQYLQLMETVTIMFMQPLVVALLAGPILGEWVGPRRLAAIGVGFLGVVLVTRPGLGGIHWAASFSFVAMGFYAAYSMMTRVLADYDPPETTMFYSAVVGIVILTPMVMVIWKAKPDAFTLAMMMLVGVFGAIGHYLLILAHRHAPAPILAPFMYTQIIWMSLFGYLIFGDIPNRWTIFGGLIVAASGLYLLHREQAQKREGSREISTKN